MWVDLEGGSEERLRALDAAARSGARIKMASAMASAMKFARKGREEMKQGVAILRGSEEDGEAAAKEVPAHRPAPPQSHPRVSGSSHDVSSLISPFVLFPAPMIAYNKRLTER